VTVGLSAVGSPPVTRRSHVPRNWRPRRCLRTRGTGSPRAHQGRELGGRDGLAWYFRGTEGPAFFPPLPHRILVHVRCRRIAPVFPYPRDGCFSREEVSLTLHLYIRLATVIGSVVALVVAAGAPFRA
jgi:hypothetical protein